MGFQDRYYYRDQPRGGGGALMWLLTGSLPLFTAFRIQVRMHASMLLALVFILLIGWGFGTTWVDRLTSAAALFTIVLLHEFGHCFAARWVGGDANQIIMHPLGGLAMAHAPRRPLPQFITVAGGPAVNVLICAVTGSIFWAAFGYFPINPADPIGPIVWVAQHPEYWEKFNSWGRYVHWVHFISWGLFVFNMLPIFPFDGGQMLQTILWRPFGYFKSMLFAATTGIIGGAILIALGLVWHQFMYVFIGLMGLMNCINYRRQLLAAGPWAFQDEDSNYGAASYSNEFDGGNTATATRPSRAAVRARKKAEQARAEEAELQETVDRILDKVSKQGMNSLTSREKRALKEATEKQRQKDR